MATAAVVRSPDLRRALDRLSLTCVLCLRSDRQRDIFIQRLQTHLDIQTLKPHATLSDALQGPATGTTLDFDGSTVLLDQQIFL